MKWTLVYFDDRPQNLALWRELLSPSFKVECCENALEWKSVIDRIRPHAILIDIRMPAINGFDLFEKIIADPAYNNCPIFFISGEISNEERIRAYEFGAVDFLSRDLPAVEVLLRISNKVKFYLQATKIVDLGNARFDVQSLKVFINNKEIDLTLFEMRLLGVILRSFPQSVSRSSLIQKLWGDETVKPGTVNTHFANLRQKIEDWDYGIKTRDDLIILHRKEPN